MKRFLLSMLVLASLGITPTVALAGPEAAKSFVDSVAKQVINVAKGDSPTKTKEAKIESIFADKVDINFIARFVLGKHWRSASPAQQSRYVAAYRPFILKNYASKLAKYSGQTYELKNARADGDASVVTMVIHDNGGEDINVDYRMRGDGSFKIVDIMVEGVSLLSTQRSEFNGIVESKGVDGLIEALKKQVAAKG